VRAILLDALGTLVRLEPPAPALRDELRSRFDVEVDEGEAASAIGAEIAYYRAHLDEGRDAASLADLRRRCTERLREALPAAARGRLGDLDALTDALLASLRFTPYDDAPGALDAFKQEGLALVVVSNWDVSLHSVLDRLGLAAALDAILTSAEAGARKPAPEIFRRALALAGVAAGEALHVGDSVHEDVAGARSAGIEPVLLRRDGASGEALVRDGAFGEALGVRTISSLAELT
jgi:putative hydrolase of the HAD superfamily